MLARLTTARRWGWHPFIVLLACAAVYWPLLGRSGFASSEGHRVVPGWTMAETGDWTRQEMFGTPYLRKPPGMAWAIGASAAVLGESEFSARAVSALSATLMALLAWWFASRWFGPPWGVAAGLAQALMPLFWPPGRSAEIEALHALGVQGTMFCLVTMLVRATNPERKRAGIPSTSPERKRAGDGYPTDKGRPSAVWALPAGAFITLALITKGPAGAPCLLGVVIGACLGLRTFRPLANLGAWSAAAIGTGAALLLLAPFIRAAAADDAVTQTVGEFLWSRDRTLGALTLAPIAFASALPASLALLFPWGPDARREPLREEINSADELHPLRIARTLAWGWVASLLLFTALGVSNPRYAMPAATLLPPLAAYVARGCSTPGTFTPARRRIARAFVLGHPAVPVGVLLIGAAAWVPWSEARRERASGRTAGLDLRALLEAEQPGANTIPVEVWADGLIEARPEVPLYARPRGDDGTRIVMRWMKVAMTHGALPPAGGFILLRHDPDGEERARYRDAIEMRRLVERGTFRAGKYVFTVYEAAG